jgi:hypothetical protein
MTKEYIFESFKALETAEAKVEYLRGLQKLNLHYDINYDALIRAWESKVQAPAEAE